MRLALTHATCWPEVRRGAERILDGLSGALAARGHRVTVLSGAWAAGRSREAGVEWRRLRRLRRDPLDHEADFGLLALPALLAGGPFDAVHAHARPDAVAAIRARAAGRVERVVFTDLGLPARWWWDRQPRRERRAHERVVAEVDLYGVMSAHAARYLVEDYGRTERVVRTPGGVDPVELAPRARHPAPVLLFSGAVTEPRKGVPVLLEALPAVAAAEPDVELWLSGPADAEVLAGWLRPLPAAVRDRVRVLGLGEARAQAERYGRAWATVLCSTDDSFGQCLVESLACGTPIVTSDHAAPPELVEEGTTGTVTPAGDAASLAGACLRALALARDAGTTAACRAAAEPFTWARLAERYEALYAGTAT